MATMFRELALALIVAIVLLLIGLALEVVPVGIEPIETPWRATVVMLIGLLIGVSGGFGWLQHSHIGTSFVCACLLEHSLQRDSVRCRFCIV
jgi:hypothetical protein|tara:strand:+ start:182 stop:457 length:276 start_codon:yes stop_codon:yes gene_type:complete